MVLGEDGHKMSKSLNNFIAPEEVVVKYGADAFRQWAAVGGSPGSDVMFRWKDVISGGRFLQKLWSMYRFSAPHAKRSDDAATNQVDRWLLFELSQMIEAVTDSMDRFQFDEAFRAIRGFAWEVLADNYIELVKSRLYGADGPEKRAAQSTIYAAIEALTSLLAPFTPFIAEEIRQNLSGESVHTSSWPKPSGIPPQPEGCLIKEVAAAVRRYKSDRGMALNSPLAGIEVYSDLDLETTDLSGSTSSPVVVKRGRPEIEMRAVEVKPQMKAIGPVFKNQSGEIIRRLTEMDPEEVARMVAAGKIEVEVGETVVELGPEAVEIGTETLSAGRAVEMIVLEGATVLIRTGS
jgi:valyl-tRNA synthetase